MLDSARRTLVTGASRPIGLEVIRYCLERGDRVIAACRNPARVSLLGDLRARYGRLEFVAFDPADAASVAEAIPVIESITMSLDLLVLVPGEAGPHDRSSDRRSQSLDSISATDLLEHYRRNTVAPLLLVRTLLPFLRAAERSNVLFITDGPLDPGEHPEGAYTHDASISALRSMLPALGADVSEYGVAVEARSVVHDASVASLVETAHSPVDGFRELLSGATQTRAGLDELFVDESRTGV